MSQADAVGLNLRALRTEALRTLEGGGEKPVAFNVVPHIDVFLDDGRTKEEWKMEVESRGIPGPLDLPVAATCMRKGAALNAVQIAEALVSQTGLHPRPSLPSSA